MLWKMSVMGEPINMCNHMPLLLLLFSSLLFSKFFAQHTKSRKGISPLSSINPFFFHVFLAMFVYLFLKENSLFRF